MRHQDNAHGTIDRVANALKSGVADTSAALGNSLDKAEDAMTRSARAARADMADAAKRASKKFNGATAAAKSDVVATTREVSDATTAGLSGLLRGIDSFLSARSGQLKDRVTDHPIRSVLVAASVGYLAALLTRSPGR